MATPETIARICQLTPSTMALNRGRDTLLIVSKGASSNSTIPAPGSLGEIASFLAGAAD